MADHDLDDVLRVGGRLCINPTDKTQDFPHGGTALGVISDVVWKPIFKTEASLAADDKFAGSAQEHYFLGEDGILGVELRQWHNDVINTIFPNTTLGTSGLRIIGDADHSATPFRPGRRLSGRAVKLLFSPDDQDNHPAVLFPKAVPMLEETAELNLVVIDEYRLLVLFHALWDTSTTPPRLYRWGKLGDLTL